MTKARGRTFGSMHQWGVAFDFYRADGTGAYNDADGFFSKVGQLGKGLGLMWGGDWVTFADKPHFQLTDWGTGPAKLKKKYGTPEKFRAAWPQKAEREEEEMTQAQFNAMFAIALAAHEKAVNAEGVSDWAAEAMEKAKEKGLLDGTKPRAAVTREQLAAVLDRMT